MQITFNPADAAEVAAVLRLIDASKPAVGAIAPEDTPDAGMEMPSPGAVFGAAAALQAFGSAVASLAPPAPVVPPVPPVPPAPPVTANETVMRDSQGLPWDARIHTESRAMNADGSWRKKRGVDPALVAQVQAEYGLGQPSAPAAIIPPPPPAAVIPPPPAPAQVAEPPPSTFVGFVQKYVALVSQGVLSNEEITQACQQAGVHSVAVLGSQPDKVPAIAATLEALIYAKTMGPA